MAVCVCVCVCVVTAGLPGSRSSLHVDNSLMPFWLTLLQGKKTFRIIRLPNWRKHLAQGRGMHNQGRGVHNESNAGFNASRDPLEEPLYSYSGSMLKPTDAFNDTYERRVPSSPAPAGRPCAGDAVPAAF